MERTFYIDDYTDECMPCDGSLQGWADWLAAPDSMYGRDEAASDGETFSASALCWQPDIVATRVAPGEWSLSREPVEEEFIALRYDKGLGWAADQIITPAVRFDTATDSVISQSMPDALRAWLNEHDDFCGDEVFIAVGHNEQGWLVTFHAGPPASCTAERKQ